MISKQEEKNIAERLLEKDVTLKKDQEWFIISSKWVSKWKKYIENENDDNPPGPINNYDILSDDEYNLKDSLIEPQDFLIIPNSLWKFLLELHGGGPQISRRVIIEGENKTKRVEVYPLKLIICTSSKGLPDQTTEQQITLSKKALVRDLKNMGMKKFNLEETRLWNIFMPALPTLLDDLDRTLEEAYIQQNQKILFEVKEQGSWTIKEKKKSISENFTGLFAKLSGGRSSKNKGLGLCGLSNLGNTCFMNSALQCLSNTPPLMDYFIRDEYKSHVNKTNPLGTKGKLANAFADLVKKMWSGNGCISPVELKYVIGQYATQFNGYRQHDSQELLAFLLDGLHEDLNRITNKPFIELKEGNGKNDDVVAKQAWEDHLRRNQSVIVDLFQGQLKSTLKCPDCNRISIKFDPFMYLSLPIPSHVPSKIFSVLFLDKIGERFAKYACNVPNSATIGDIKQDLYSQLKSDDEITFADMNGYRINQVLNDSQSISEIRSSDKIVAVRKPEGRVLEIFVSQRIMNGDTWRFCCIPIILYLDSKTTGKDLYQVLIDHTKRFCTEELDFDNLHFSLSYVNSSGEKCGNQHCSNEKCLGCSIVPSDDVLSLLSFNISVDWKEEKYVKWSETMTVTSMPNPNKNPSKQNISLQDCLYKFSEAEKLGPNDEWYCPECKAHKQAMKNFGIWSVPDILIVHLKRFLYSKHSGSKLTTFVDFPIEGLDVSKFLVQKNDAPILYDLYGISNHSGSLFGGHYTADCLNVLDGHWYHFNDSSVSSQDSSSLKSGSAYVLFYKKRK